MLPSNYLYEEEYDYDTEYSDNDYDTNNFKKNYTKT